jgi:hypothetical protein
VKKEGPNQGKKLYKCDRGMYDSKTNKTYGGCKYFRMEGDPVKYCEEPGCGRTLMIWKGSLSTAHCVNIDCPSKVRKSAYKTKMEEELLPLLEKANKSFLCSCEDTEHRAILKKWPMVKFVCGGKDREKECGYYTGVEIQYAKEDKEQKTPIGIEKLFSSE